MTDMGLGGQRTEGSSVWLDKAVMALKIFSGVIGKSRMEAPVAFRIAPAMAGGGVLMTTSPMDLTPKGPEGS